MQRSSIAPSCLQSVLESASNAADKGQSQWFTPIDFGKHLAGALPLTRKTLVDLTCGRGDLLAACAGRDTKHLLGLDIESPNSQTPKPEFLSSGLKRFSSITSDLTPAYPHLVDVGWRADLFVLNPPFGLQWDVSRLDSLAQSECPAVATTFAAFAPSREIDSTLATLLIALDRMTEYGEGLLIANHATVQRLLLESALVRHIWAHLILPGNPMTGCVPHMTGGASVHASHWRNEYLKDYHTSVLYFARDHDNGPIEIRWTHPWTSPNSQNQKPEFLSSGYPLPERQHRLGSQLRDYLFCEHTVPRWQAVKEHLEEVSGLKAPRVPWNLWLNTDGTIGCDLSLFEQAVSEAAGPGAKLDRQVVKRLFNLRGQRPMQLVVQRARRDELLAHVAQTSTSAGSGGVPPPLWRVQPELAAAVHKCVNEYHQKRAPLRPLPAMQRLGYLDEENSILCLKDLYGEKDEAKPNPGRPIQPSTFNLQPLFAAGQRYPLRTRTVKVVRKVRKPDTYTGAMEDLEYTGQQLAFYLQILPVGEAIASGLKDSTPERSFMDAMFRDENTTVDDHRVRPKSTLNPQLSTLNSPIDFTTQELVDHFEIPEVPDVATVNPDGYRENLRKLEALEQITEVLSGPDNCNQSIPELIDA